MVLGLLAFNARPGADIDDRATLRHHLPPT
jgi:hypothetical protein